MSYMALATAQYDVMVDFYGETLKLPIIRAWERAGSRGCVFDLFGLQVEILDAHRETKPLDLPPAGDRVHLVAEVEDLASIRRHLDLHEHKIVETSWGSRILQIQDPDGVSVCFLEWVRLPASMPGVTPLPDEETFPGVETD